MQGLWRSRVWRIGLLMVVFCTMLMAVPVHQAGAAPAAVPEEGSAALVSRAISQDGGQQAAPEQQAGVEVDSQDGGQEAQPDQETSPVQQASPEALPPIFTIWYGSTQSFGSLGNPQKEINVLGNVQKADALYYRLNGVGTFEQIAIGGVQLAAFPEGQGDAPAYGGGMNDLPAPPSQLPTADPKSPALVASPRLEYEGDFNVELSIEDLLNGPNTLELRAVGPGGETNKTLTINYSKGKTGALPYIIDWSTVTNINDVAMVVEGDWKLENGTVRPAAYGYDRMIAIGDIGWTDFQITVPVTIHDFPFENSGGVGIVNRWEGHFQVADEQPGNGWWNLGAYGFFLHRTDANGGRRLAMYTGHYDLHEDKSGYVVNRFKPYYFQLRSQTKEAGKSGFYSFKVWDPSLETEADAPWILEVQDAPPDELFSGAAALVAHDIDASFGRVEILPVLDVNVATVGNGTVQVTPALTGQSDAYLYGDSIELKALPTPGWAFAGWSGDLQGNENPKSVVLAGDLNVTATFVEGQAYRLDLEVAGSGQVELDPAGPWYAEGTVVKLRPVADNGWTFSGWSGADAGALQKNSDGSWSLTMSKDRAVKATFVRKQYALTVTTAGQGTVTKNPNRATYEHGTQVQLTPNPAAGWAFTGWSGDLSGGDNPATILMDGPKTVTAHFGDADVGPLVYDSHAIDDDTAGESSGNGDAIVNCGETIELYVDLGNQGTETATGVSTSISTDSPYATLVSNASSSYPNIAGGGTQTNADDFEVEVARNAPNEHKIVFALRTVSTNGGLHYDSFEVPVACATSEGTVDRQVNTSDDDAEERQYGRVYLRGSDLELVEDDDGPQTVGIRFPNVTIPQGTAIAEAYLEFTADEEGSRATNVTFNCQASDNAPLFEGTEFSLSTLPKSTTSVAWKNVPPWTLIGERHRTPNLAPIVQEIVNRGGWQSGNALAFLITGEGTRTAESFDGNRPDEAPRLHITYGREPTCYTLDASANPAAGGAIALSPAPNCGGNKYIEGTQVTLAASASPGWVYGGWAGDLTGTVNPVSISMTADKTITANFTEAQYLLNVNVVGTGTVAKKPDKATYTYGEQVTLTATAPAGWTFTGWSGDLSGSTNPVAVTMNGNKSITVIFAANEYTLTVNLVGKGTVTRQPNQATYQHGEQVQLTATANLGWLFGGWSGDLSGSTSPAMLTMDGDKTVTATFTGLVGPLVYTSHTVDDDTTGASNGNGNAFVDCGETAELVVNLFNQGGADVLSANGTISTSDAYVTLGSVNSAYGNIAGESAGANQTKYTFTVANDTPHLHYITFDLNASAANGGPWPLSFQVPIACEANMGKADTAVVASNDDAEEQTVDGSVATKGGDLELGEDDLGPQWVGLRFQSLVIPQGANIGKAFLEFTAAQAGSTATSVVIRGQGSDNATSFVGSNLGTITAGEQGVLEVSNYDISSRPRTTASVSWTNVPGWVTGGKYQSPDLAAVIQEIVNRPGWSPGNAIVLMINGSGRRTAHSFEGEPGMAPRLWIEFGGDLTCYDLQTAAVPPSGGSVVASPGANCGASRYLEGTAITLKAEPALDHAFTGWSGDVQGTANPATVIMDANHSATASFGQATCHNLATAVDPAGSGTVTATPEPNCGGGKYVAGTSVQLIATPLGLYQFGNWTGAATGTVNPLTVVVDADKAVTANFTTCFSLTAIGVPDGTGEVVATPPPNCSGGKYMAGTQVQLMANPVQGYSFSSWGGAATGAENPTTVTMSGSLVVVANFGEGSCRTLIGRAVPTGSGQVTLSPPPNCPDGKYESGTRVTATAIPGAAYEFRRWSGAGSGTTNPATVIVGNQTTVTAELGLRNIQATISLPVMLR